ncbi:sigma-70 family RNA polymerase sigma factor [Cohnella nanjingensis]|uniref:RNA polymerase sigma factor n=2 Tax=Cohnella nanjingensis TaxID=1387779 RepID=A0A7X0RWE1_9BACL|nr:sigma-70 family RNA polymerase sigma factor [Cohnella nanjingensis]
MFIAHSPYVYGIALMLTRSKTLADDVTQETFLRAFQKYHLFDAAKPIRPWLYRITVNLTRNLLRKQRWLTFFGQMPEEARTDYASLDELLLRTEREQELWQAVNRLSKRRREVVALHYYVGLPLQEAAYILDIPLGTCKSRLHAALKQLRMDEADLGPLRQAKEDRA